MADMFDDFQFKPLTEGLGFHKKASGSKPGSSRQSTQGEASVEAKPARFETRQENSFSMRSSRFAEVDSETETLDRSSRSAGTQSISDLIASLPPSLDFMEDTPKPTSRSSASQSSFGKPSFDVSAALESTESYTGRAQIFQPLAREDYKSQSASMSSTSSSMPNSSAMMVSNNAGQTIGNVLPSSGMKAGSSVMVPPAPLVPTIPAPTTSVNPKPASPYRERLDESFARAFPHADKTKPLSVPGADLETLQPTTPNFGAAILDAMVVAGVATIMLVCVLAITRINLVGLLTNAKTDGPTQDNLFLMFVAVLQMYMLTARSFFGATLGEWAFDQQLGRDQDQRRMIYPLQVAWRSILMTVTGFVVIPVLSAAFRRDLGKYLTGVGIYRRI